MPCIPKLPPRTVFWGGRRPDGKCLKDSVPGLLVQKTILKGPFRVFFVWVAETEKSMEGSLLRYPGNGKMAQGSLVVASLLIGSRTITTNGNICEGECFLATLYDL